MIIQTSLNCHSDLALQVLTARCQGKQSCLVRASKREFGDPCYSGTRKYLSVIYTCGVVLDCSCLNSLVSALCLDGRETGFVSVDIQSARVLNSSRDVECLGMA
ncbi:unnamed protein product [Coregonus sp. 'balchen']|nr:unnamed protein product [Coregonus sp. 'balchen']